MQNTRVFILCAGEGKRLRPYTENQPKCLVPYKGKPLLQYQLDVFKELGLNDIVLIGGYRHEALPKNFPIIYNEFYATTNMVYSLFCANDFMNESVNWIISYGDIIYHPSVLQALLEAKHPYNVVTDIDWQNYWSNRMENPLEDAETFRWNQETHQIFELGKKPKSLTEIQGQYIGLLKISATATKTFKQAYKNFSQQFKNYKNAYMTDFLQYLIDKKFPIFGVPIHNQWAEFDTTADLNLTISWL